MKASDDLRYEHDAILFALQILEKMADLLNSGEEIPPEDIGGMIDFFRTFADKCHHGKEENFLFPAYEEAGIHNHGGPIGTMLKEHQTARGYIRLMDDSAACDPFHKDKFIKSASEYITLVREHIERENNVLFPMGDARLTQSKQEGLLERFEEYEETVIGEGKHEQLHDMLEQFRTRYFRRK